MAGCVSRGLVARRFSNARGSRVVTTVSFVPVWAPASTGLAGVRVRPCGQAGGPIGSGSAEVRFGADGTVSNAVVGPPFAGTAVGACVERLYKKARIPSMPSAPPPVRVDFFLVPP